MTSGYFEYGKWRVNRFIYLLIMYVLIIQNTIRLHYINILSNIINLIYYIVLTWIQAWKKKIKYYNEIDNSSWQALYATGLPDSSTSSSEI